MNRYKDLPPIPARIRRLDELAANLWWSWHYASRKAFRDLDYQLWRTTAHNPVRMLWLVSRERLEHAARDPDYLATYNAAVAGLDEALQTKATWMARRFPDLQNGTIAYFSAEFAIHQSLPIYAGGLGVLAGDHCKQASDLGVPLVGVGFMYPQGYFHQTVSQEGWQLEVYEKLNWPDVAIEQALKPDGSPCIVAVPLGDRAVLTNVWKVTVGRVHLYLLDTGLEENAPQDRDLSARLYGGDRETRLQQEIILGIGGVRALSALGIAPSVWHLNEGHAAFVVLQRIHEFTAEETASIGLERVRRATVFTTHTPVAAGHDAFAFDRVEHHLQGAWGPVADDRARFLALGEYHGQFNMTVLALRTAGWANGVSRLHGTVTRRMWEPLLAEREANGQHPLTTITNGVHAPTWLALELARLFERYIGPDWRDRCDDADFWNRVLTIPDEELWQARTALRAIPVHVHPPARPRSVVAGDVSAAAIVAAGPLLDPGALTIGFARRFAAYKRPKLIFKDPARLIRILSAPAPARAGRLRRKIPSAPTTPASATFSRSTGMPWTRSTGDESPSSTTTTCTWRTFSRRAATSGSTRPRKPFEASGTSGMKAAINGVPHLSIGDGWWAEAYNGSNGWTIDGGALGDDTEAQDAADADALYRLLEEQVIPTSCQRDHSVSRTPGCASSRSASERSRRSSAPRAW